MKDLTNVEKPVKCNKQTNKQTLRWQDHQCPGPKRRHVQPGCLAPASTTHPWGLHVYQWRYTFITWVIMALWLINIKHYDNSASKVIVYFITPKKSLGQQCSLCGWNVPSPYFILPNKKITSIKAFVIVLYKEDYGKQYIHIRW